MTETGPDLEALFGRLADEFMDRLQRGDDPDTEEYAARYPQLARQIREGFPVLRTLRPSGGGEVLAGPERYGEFRLVRRIGRGGMGVVYEAVQEPLGRRVALKILAGPLAADPTARERFRREARTAAGLHHTHIVPVYAVGEQDGMAYYAMQLIDGRGLDDVIAELRSSRGAAGTASTEQAPADAGAPTVTGALPGPERPGSDRGEEDTSTPAAPVRADHIRQAASLGVQAAEALDYAHRHGVLHRDVKPSNLLLDSGGNLWVSDFGLAKVGGADDLTHTGNVFGTLRYMAPERFDGLADARSDVYGLGVTLYELVTLRPAFPETEHARVIERVRAGGPEPPRRVDGRVPRDLETVILKAMARDPRDRYASAADLAADLRRFVADQPVTARRHWLPERAWRLARRNPVVSSLLAAVMLLIVGSAVGAWVMVFRLRAENSQRMAAEQDAKNRLRQSLLDEARARRWSGQAGRQFESLDALARAAGLRPDLDLRNEAVACMALRDIRKEREWEGRPQGTHFLAVDRRFEHYARMVAGSEVSVRRVADDVEVARARFPRLQELDIARFSPDGRLLAIRHGDTFSETITLWDWGRQVATPVPGLTGAFWAHDFSPDGKRFAAVDHLGVLHVIDVATGREHCRSDPGPVPNELAFDPTGALVAISSEREGSVLIRQADGGQVVLKIDQLPGPRGVAWDPDGKHLAVACANFEIQIWDTTAEPLSAVHLAGHEAEVTSVAYSPRGDLLASASWDNTIRLWDPVTHTELVRAEAIGPQLRFSADGRRLGWTQDGGKVAVWELGGGTEYRELTGHLTGGKGPWNSDFSSKGHLLATGSADGVCLWDVDHASKVAFLPLGMQPDRRDRVNTSAAVFSGGADAIITSGQRGLHRWPLDFREHDSTSARLGPPQRLGRLVAAAGLAVSGDGQSVAAVSGLEGAQGSTGWVLDLDKEGTALQL
jgi:serine/threonine protein kinase/WD40 repeat protein